MGRYGNLKELIWELLKRQHVSAALDEWGWAVKCGHQRVCMAFCETQPVLS